MIKDNLESNNKQQNKPLLSIITINWNVSDKLKKCIDSVIHTIKDINYEMFIIDNNSEDEDFNKIINKYSKYKQLKFSKNEINEGPMVVNKFKDKIKGNYLLLLGPDAILTKDAVNNLVKYMDNNKDAGAASALLLNPDKSLQMYYFKFFDILMVFYIDTLVGLFLDRFLFKNKKHQYYLGKNLDVNNIVELDQPPAACLIVRYSLLDKDKYIIDPDFSFFYNDVDLCRRIWDKGYKIFLIPNVKVIHDSYSSFKKADQYWARQNYMESQIKYFRKHQPEYVGMLKTMIFFNYILEALVKPVLKNIRGNNKGIPSFAKRIRNNIRICKGVLKA